MAEPTGNVADGVYRAINGAIFVFTVLRSSRVSFIIAARGPRIAILTRTPVQHDQFVLNISPKARIVGIPKRRPKFSEYRRITGIPQIHSVKIENANERRHLHVPVTFG